MSSTGYRLMGEQLGELVERKQAAYGDSFGKSGEVMRILYPDGIRPEQLDDALAVTRVVDKLFRIATARDAFGESPWGDIAGYGLLGQRRAEQRRAERSRTDSELLKQFFRVKGKAEAVPVERRRRHRS